MTDWLTLWKHIFGFVTTSGEVGIYLLDLLSSCPCTPWVCHLLAQKTMNKVLDTTNCELLQASLTKLAAYSPFSYQFFQHSPSICMQHPLKKSYIIRLNFFALDVMGVSVNFSLWYILTAHCASPCLQPAISSPVSSAFARSFSLLPAAFQWISPHELLSSLCWIIKCLAVNLQFKLSNFYFFIQINWSKTSPL